jgi:hypothetical protein
VKQTVANPLIFFTICSFLGVHHTYGQDQAFPMVHEEPYHKPLYEDETIRLLDVQAAKNDTTSFHIHCLPILYITLSGTEVALQTYADHWKRVPLPTGWIGHDMYHPDSCFTHRFSVVGESALQIAAIEFKKSSTWRPLNSEAEYQSEGFELFRLGHSNLESSASWPVIALAKECHDTCEIKVIDSIKLVDKDFEKYRLYQVCYEGI